MANANQVIINGKTILDLRSDTVTPETLQKGYTAHDKSGTKITGTLEASSSGGAKETWVIKSDASGELVTTQISFTSNGQKFTSIGANYNDSGTFIILRYDNNEVAGWDIYGGGAGFEFENEAYRKLTFDTPPTGDLLTWLQSNAVKQPDDTAVQDTKALTITSNGTVSVTPDVPYDGLSSVDVTVNVSGGGGGSEYETCAVQIKGTFNSGGSIAYAELKNGTIKTSLQYFINPLTLNDFISINVLKNSLFVACNTTTTFSTEGNVVSGSTGKRGYFPFWVTGDCKINFS